MAKDWSAEETARIISEVKNPTCSNQELAKQLGRSAQSVAAKKRHLAGQLETDQKSEKKNDRHRGRHGRKQSAKPAQEPVTAVQEKPAEKAEASAPAEGEKKPSDRRSRGRRGGKKSAQAAKPLQEPVTAVQEKTAEKAETPAPAEGEKKSSDRRSRGRRGGRKNAQSAKPAQEPKQESAQSAGVPAGEKFSGAGDDAKFSAPPAGEPELKIPDVERDALAELDKFFRISDLTKPAAEITHAEPDEQPEEPEQELPAVHIWTREEDSMLLIAPLRSEDDLAAELHCTREEIHARREQLKKQRMEEKERRQRDFHARRAEAQKKRRVPLERCTTELKTETEAAEEWAEAEAAAAYAETEAAEDGDKRITAIRAAVSMLRGSAEASAVPAVRDFLAVTDFILGSGI